MNLGWRGYVREQGGAWAQIGLVLGAAGVLLAFFGTWVGEARLRSKITDCKGSCKQLGVYLVTYVSRYGSDRDYPRSTLPAGHLGGGLADGPNGAFWGHLWRLPGGVILSETGANPRAISKRPGEDGLYLCKAYRRVGGSASLDYASPELGNEIAFPGGILSEAVQSRTFIGGDLVTAGDENHPPEIDFNAMQFDGSVTSVLPGSAEAARYLQETNARTAPRTR